MKKTFLIFAFSVFHLTMFSQIPPIIDHLRYFPNDDRYEGFNKYEGSIYLNNDFVLGNISDIQNGTSQPAYLRFNLLDDIVEIKLTPNSERRILPKIDNIKYDFGAYALILRGEENNKSYYLEFYNEENLKFIAKPELAATRKKSDILGIDNILIFQDYKYYIIKDNDMKEIHLKTKDLKQIFAGNSIAENYLKSHKVNNIDKIKQFLEFYGND
ncbi:hypothetical protein L1I30_13875 [Gillisia sp. M10.2A]|uniref:Uncharacterized protein n=1 Tax=Gillisia lutea TaxID=2909668 RepID=A0ABS9EIS8_9FLAO|nr:hypothetical protein [Gillisia lutea]MCF4102762.1 hypothetical protein [Gillisia lutea]